MKIGKFGSLLLGASLLASVAACSNTAGTTTAGANSTTTVGAIASTTSQQASAGTTVSSAEKVTLNFYAWSDEEGIFTKFARLFEDNNPNVKINTQFTPSNDYNTKLLTAFSGGGEIDAFGVSSPPSLAQYQAKEQVMKLDDFIASKKTDTSGFAGILDSIKIDGGIFALPYKTSSWVVYYNKDIFDTAGVPYPKGEWTWEEYYDIAGKLTSGEGADKIYGSLNFQPTSTWWRVPANSKGSINPLVDDQLADWMKAAEYAKSLSDAGYQPLYEDMASEAGADYTGNFLQGKYGMFYTGDWEIEMLNTAIKNGDGSVNYDIAPLPHWEGEEPATPGAAGLLMVAKNAKNPELAYDFISFMSGAEGSKILLENDYFPAWQSEETIELYTTGKETPEHIEFIVNQKIISQVPTDELYNSAANVVKEEVSLFLIGEQDIETTQKNIKERLKNEVINAN